MITSYGNMMGKSVISVKNIDNGFNTQVEKVYGKKQPKPSQPTKMHNCDKSYDCASDSGRTGWNRSEVPEYKSIAPRDYNLPQINTSLYVDSLTLW